MLCAVIPLGSVHVCLLGSDCKNVLPRVDSYHLCLSHVTGWVVYVLMEFCLPGNQSHPPRQARGGGGSAARGTGQGKEHAPYGLTSAYHGGGWVLCKCCQRMGVYMQPEDGCCVNAARGWVLCKCCQRMGVYMLPEDGCCVNAARGWVLCKCCQRMGAV